MFFPPIISWNTLTINQAQWFKMTWQQWNQSEQLRSMTKKEDYTTSSQTNANDRILHQYYKETMLGRMTSST